MRGHMKKFCIALLTLIFIFTLTSCDVEVHWSEHSTYVPWYVVWIPVIAFIIIVLSISHIYIIKKQYVCPKCGKVFKPRWYEFSSWIHMGSDRVMRCPKCNYKGFCRKCDE